MRPATWFVACGDERYAYLKNYMPWAPNGQQLQYMYRMRATRAWHQHHQEGKTDAITGRFFRPRVSEEFYDTVEDFDNVHNLIDEAEHQEKITALKTALRNRQLALFDSGLLPEGMRVRRAEENQITIYEMVRDPKLYPLESYLDLSDLALSTRSRESGGLRRGARGRRRGNSLLGNLWAVSPRRRCQTRPGNDQDCPWR